MSPCAEVFEGQRARLRGIACRMLGSRAEADDVLQDAYLRWHASDRTAIRSAPAFLVTVTARLCVDRLRVMKQERARHAGTWLPEPVADERIPSPETRRELADDLSLALAALLERLRPKERAAFLLYEVFDYDYGEVAQALGKAEPACRQLIHRARAGLRGRSPRAKASAESRDRLLGKFLVAAESGSREAVMSLLAEDIGDKTG